MIHQKALTAFLVTALSVALAAGCGDSGEDEPPPSEAEVREFLLASGQVEEGVSPFTDQPTLLVTSVPDCEITAIYVDPMRVALEADAGGIVNDDQTVGLASSGTSETLTACDQEARQIIAGF